MYTYMYYLLHVTYLDINIIITNPNNIWYCDISEDTVSIIQC